MNTIKTITQVSADLNIKPWQIRHLYAARYLDKPQTFAGRYAFTERHINEIKTYLEQKKATTNETALEEIFSE